MKKFIIANWKAAPATLAQARQILDATNDYLEGLGETREFNLIFCPPLVFIEEVAKILKTSHLSHQAGLGVQDIATKDEGALTGEVSGTMLKKLGADYVIIGHSERRWKLGETNETVNKKLKAALRNELVPIVCIGERVRDDNFIEFIKNQVSETFKDLSPEDVRKCIIAYEPVWAISVNLGAHPDTPSSACESVRIIDQALNYKFKIQGSRLVYLYGGSVNSTNVVGFLKEKKIGGVLIGSASTNEREFIKILSMTNGAV